MAYLQVHVVQCHNLTQPKSFFSLAPSLFVSLQFGKQTQRTPESKEAQWDYACSFPVEHNTEDSSRQLEVKLMNGRVMAAKKVVGVWKMDLEQLLGDSERRLALPVPSADTSTTLELRVLVSGVNEELPLGTTSPMTAQAPPAAEPAPGPAPAPEPRGECLAQELADLSDDGEHALPPPLLDEQSAPKHEIVSMNDAPLCSVEEVARVGAVPCRIPIKKVMQNGTPARGRPVKCISDAYALDGSNSDEAGDLKFLKGSVHSLDDDDGANEWEYDGDSEMDSNAVVVEDLSGDDEWD